LPQPKLLIATHNRGKLREYRQLLREAPFELISLEDLGINAEVEETGSTFHENARLKGSSYAALSGLLTLADDSGLEVDALGGEPGVRSARYGEESPVTPLYERGDGGISSGEGRSGGNSDAGRVRLLLRKLEGVPWERRTARFRCVIAIATPAGGGSLNAAPRSETESPSPPASLKEIPPNPPFIKGGVGGFGPKLEEQQWGDLTLVVGSVAGMIQYSPLGDEGFGYDPVFYLPSFQLTMAQLPLEAKNRISHRADAARKAAALLLRIGLGYDY